MVSKFSSWNTKREAWWDTLARWQRIWIPTVIWWVCMWFGLHAMSHWMFKGTKVEYDRYFDWRLFALFMLPFGLMILFMCWSDEERREERKLKAQQRAAELALYQKERDKNSNDVILELPTRSPSKWRLVDLESKSVYIWDDGMLAQVGKDAEIRYRHL